MSTTASANGINGASNGAFINQTIHEIDIPESVRRSGIPTPEIIAEGVTYFHRDGIIILNNAIETSHLDALNQSLAPEAARIASDLTDSQFNFGRKTQNITQLTPSVPELMFEDVWANPFAAGILSAILGPRPTITFARGNTALKSTDRQPVHSDLEFAHPLFPFAIAINIGLVDISPENGGTEIWVGSHRDSNIDQHAGSSTDSPRDLRIQETYMQQRAKHSPPIQLSLKKGSLVLRDLRLWHAGRANKTDEPRVLLAFICVPEWYQGLGRVLLPASVRELVESWRTEFQYAVEYEDGEFNWDKPRVEPSAAMSGNGRLLELEPLMHSVPKLDSHLHQNGSYHAMGE